MALATSNTTTNIGIRRMIYSITTPAYRNFEPDALHTVRRGSVDYAGTVYSMGTEIPFDGTLVYLNPALLEVLFNDGTIDPSV
jgi:hypothetical protein